MVKYEVARTFKLSLDDDRHLREIMDAVGVKQAEAMRFALEVASIMLQFAAENDPKAVFIEYQHQKGKVVYPEKMSEPELAEILLYVREQVGQAKFDNLIKQGREQREFLKRQEAYFIKAREDLSRTSEGPFSYEEIASAIQKAADYQMPLFRAKAILDSQWKKSMLRQVSPRRYTFVREVKERAVSS